MHHCNAARLAGHGEQTRMNVMRDAGNAWTELIGAAIGVAILGALHLTGLMTPPEKLYELAGLYLAVAVAGASIIPAIVFFKKLFFG